MTQVNPSLPVVGQPNSTEEPKISVALGQIVGAVNNIDSSQIVDGTIATADLANNAVTAAKIEAQQAWQTVALGGGGTWTPANLSYYKDSLGIVHLRGDQSSFTRTVSGSATLFTLPAGYRPVNTQGFTIVRRDGVAPQPIEITSAGVVSTVNGLAAGVLYSFGLVHFRAEN